MYKKYYVIHIIKSVMCEMLSMLGRVDRSTVDYVEDVIFTKSDFEWSLHEKR